MLQEEAPTTVEVQEPIPAISNKENPTEGVPPTEMDQPIEETQGQSTYEELQAECASLREYKEENIRSNQSLMQAFQQNPELVGIMRMMNDGASFAEAVARNIDLESLAPTDGEPDFEKWNKSKLERAEAVNASRELASKIKGNIELSQKSYTAFLEKNKLTEEEAMTLGEKLQELVNDIADGKIDEFVIETVFKSLNFDKIVEAAKEEGALEVKNAKIDKMRTDVKKEKGDGLPHLASAGVTETEKIPAKKSEMEMIAAAANRKF